jgi:probable rRNA maturation factor
MALQITGARLLRTDQAASLTAARAVFKAAKFTGLDVGVTFVLDLEMQALNRRWRKKNKPTDVLSFSAFEGEFVMGDDTFLGDLVLSVETAARQAREQAHSLDVEIGVLVCHGLCHLAGLDHERGVLEAERQLMVEMNILSCAGLPVTAALAGRG